MQGNHHDGDDWFLRLLRSSFSQRCVLLWYCLFLLLSGALWVYLSLLCIAIFETWRLVSSAIVGARWDSRGWLDWFNENKRKKELVQTQGHTRSSPVKSVFSGETRNYRGAWPDKSYSCNCRYLMAEDCSPLDEYPRLELCGFSDV